MKNKAILVTMALITCLQWSFAQDRTISGTITDIDGEPLIGATVNVLGASTGTATDIDGTYSLNVPADAKTLEFSYVGYLTQEVPLGASNVVDIQLEQDIANLEEVIVIGYGTRKKRDVTSSVSQIESKEISKSVALSPEFALQGKTPGVQVQLPSGDPNERSTIRIRGVNTLGFNDPLIIIDGVPVAEFGAGAVFGTSTAAATDLRGTQNILNLINPDDIASISVLKDAAATAVYGLRASNGVILIETKRGQGVQQKAKVTFTAERGIRNVRKTYDVLTTPEYVSLLTEQYNNANEPLVPWLDPDTSAYLGGTTQTYDWQEELLNKNAIVEDYILSVSGGGRGSNYYFSAGYSNQEGSLKYNGVKRYSVALNSDFQVTKWLKIGETFRTALTEGDDSRTADLSGVFNVPAWQPYLDPNNRFGYAVVRDESGALLYGNETESNVFARSTINSRKYTTFRSLGNAYVQISPLPGLIIKGSIGIDFIYNQRKVLDSKNAVPYNITGSAANGSSYGERHLRNFNMVQELLVGYNKTFGQKHNIDLIFNITDQEYSFNGIGGSANGIRFEEEDVVTVTPAALGAEANAESFREVRKLSGTLFRLSYNYDSKYYLDGSWRRDGSSVFAPGNRFGNFYGISAAWRVSGESFLKDNSFISDLKLRASWGQSGNQETRPFGYSANISLNPRYPLGGDGNLAIGSFPQNFPVNDLTWEKTTSYNYGVDAAFLDYKLTFTLEYYDKLTDGILRPFNLPITAGINENPVINLAEVSNKGIEVQLGWQDKIGDFTYSLSGNLTTINNKVEKLFLANSDNDRVLVNPDGNTAIQVGQPINFYYGWQTDGIFQTDGEASSWADQNDDKVAGGTKAAGDFAFTDLFGDPDPDSGEFRSTTPDGQINDFDKTNLGSTIPGYFYGINVGLGFKGFDASLFFQGVGDIQKLNSIRRSGEGMNSQGLNSLATVRDRWTPSNPSQTMPRALLNDQVSNGRLSDRWIEDASYFRFANFQFGYSFGNSVLQKLKFDNIRVYVSGTNLALITNYSGLDPEGSDGNPPPVVWLMGVNATF